MTHKLLSFFNSNFKRKKKQKVMFEIKVKYFEDTLFAIHFKVQSPKVLTQLF